MQHTSLSAEETACVNNALTTGPLCLPYEVLTYPKVAVDGVVITSQSDRMNSRNDYTVGYRDYNGPTVTQYAIVHEVITIRQLHHSQTHFALVRIII